MEYLLLWSQQFLSQLGHSPVREHIDQAPAYVSAFKHFKEDLISKPILKLPCWEKPFVIETDSSATRIGAALKHLYNGGLVIMSYASQILNVQKFQHSTTKREGLAVVWAIDHFIVVYDGDAFCNCD